MQAPPPPLASLTPHSSRTYLASLLACPALAPYPPSRHSQALEAAQTAIERFEAAGLAWQRPTDYYAEMVKSDEHMAKVKEQLLFEKQQIEAAEQRWVLGEMGASAAWVWGQAGQGVCCSAVWRV